MTEQEFVFWFSGYVSAIQDRVRVPNQADWERIVLALKKVSLKNNTDLIFVGANCS